MSIKIFVDGAHLEDMLQHYQNSANIGGFTTNPSLMKKAGVSNYEDFAKEVLLKIKELPISFEVFADDLKGMEQQAQKIAAWGESVYVKIPVTNTQGISTAPLIERLSAQGVKLNVTAIFTLEQTQTVIDSLNANTAAIISIFAGRIADTGVDPMPIMSKAVEMAQKLPAAEVLWASTREAYNLKQAEQCGCHIITVPPAIIHAANKNFGKSLDQYSLETVQAFHHDATHAGFHL